MSKKIEDARVSAAVLRKIRDDNTASAPDRMEAIRLLRDMHVSGELDDAPPGGRMAWDGHGS